MVDFRSKRTQSWCIKISIKVYLFIKIDIRYVFYVSSDAKYILMNVNLNKGHLF